MKLTRVKLCGETGPGETDVGMDVAMAEHSGSARSDPQTADEIPCTTAKLVIQESYELVD